MKINISILLVILCFCSSLSAQKAITQDERMQWWREARFGLFIHWGLYSIPAGEWNGKQIPGIGEWIMGNIKIPVSEYRQLASKFNPVKFNAHDFVATAKNAGMKYLSITAKHHDGFAMYKSSASNYNIVDATPYGKDVLKELSEECQKQGLKFCFYYSQSRDWNELNGLGNDWDFPKERDFKKYLEEKVKPQLTELLTNYGPIGMIWFDTPMTISKEDALSIKELVRKLQPECIISGRLSYQLQLDYTSTGDNIIPSSVLAGDWEVPATLNDTWGFKKNDNNWKSSDVLTRMLFDIVSKGGNYLLNVGPDAEGVIPKQSVEILAKVGDWLRINNECIYGTNASPYKNEFKWGNITQKPGKLYLGLFNWPTQPFYLEGLKTKVKKVYLLSDKSQKAIKFTSSFDKTLSHNRLIINLPKQTPDKVLSVVVLEIDGPAIVETEICQQADKTVLLPIYDALVLKKGKPSAAIKNSGTYNWKDSTMTMQWSFKIEKAGTYQVNLVSNEVGNHSKPEWQGGHFFNILSANQEIKTTITDDSREYNPRSQYWKKVHSKGGKITFDKPGNYKLDLIPIKLSEGKYGFTFQEINLIPSN